MNELRVDPLTGLKSIIAAGRASRPGGGFHSEPADPVDPEKDPFLEGHEDRTPPEVWALRPGGGEPDTPGWLVRSVPNLYPAVSPGAEAPPPHPNPDLFTAQAAAGTQEVIVNAPVPVTSLADLTVEQVETTAMAWRTRMRAHSDAAFVHLLVNERREGGASLPHTHAQLYALPFVPAAVARERERFTAYATRTMGGNLLGDLLQEEVRMRDRIVAIDDDAVLLAPYASRLPVPAHARPAPHPCPLRGRGPHRRRAPARRAAAPAAAARRLPAAEPVDPHRAPGRRHVLLADRHPAAADPPRRPRARGRHAPLRRRARGGSTRASRRLADNRRIQRAPRAPMSTLWTNGIVWTLLAGLDSNG